MAVAYDTVTSISLAGTTSFSVNHTASGSDRLAVLCLGWWAGDRLPTSITYGGSAMTSVATARTDERAQMWRFIAPATSATACAGEWSLSVSGYGGVLTFTGVDQTTPIGTANTSSSSTGTATSTSAVTSATDGMCVDAFIVYNKAAAAPDTGQTSRVFGVASGEYGGASTEAGAASVTMGWTWSGNTAWGHVVAPINASSTGTTVTTGVGALTLAGLAPTATVNNKVATTGVGALILAGLAPTALVNNKIAATATGALTISGQAPTVGVKKSTAAGVGALTLAGLAPSVAVNNTVAPTLLTNGNTFGVPAVTRGSVSLSPTLVTNASSFGAAEITQGVALAPSLVTNASTFGSPTITVGGVSLVCSIFVNQSGFGAHLLTGGVERKRHGGGTSKKRYRRKYVVTVDGEDFVIASREEAQALLDGAKSVAESVFAEAPRVATVAIRHPRIRVSGQPGPELNELISDVATARNEIRAIYEQARRNAELGYLLRRAHDEDESVTAMLL